MFERHSVRDRSPLRACRIPPVVLRGPYGLHLARYTVVPVVVPGPFVAQWCRTSYRVHPRSKGRECATLEAEHVTLAVLLSRRHVNSGLIPSHHYVSVGYVTPSAPLVVTAPGSRTRAFVPSTPRTLLSLRVL